MEVQRLTSVWDDHTKPPKVPENPSETRQRNQMFVLKMNLTNY